MPRASRVERPPEPETFPLEYLVLAELRPHARNDGRHPEEELAHLKASLQTHGVYRNVVVAEDGTILAGHGVIAAAQALGYTTLPGRRMPYGADDPRALHLLVGDNHIAQLRLQDDAVLAALLQDISRDDFAALLGTGYDAKSLGGLLETAGGGTGTGGSGPGRADNYSRKVESPLYTPHGPKPDVETLCDMTRTQALLAEIDEADLPDGDKAFLRLAAARHTVFQYKSIAEYYAHADAPLQRLMENSGLVIIDFNRAIELGFVKLTADIAAQYAIDDDANT